MANTYTLIEAQTLTSNAASVTFSSIPATYTDLVVRLSTRNNQSTYYGPYLITLNSDTATNYSTTYIYGDGVNAGSGRDTSVANVNELFGNGDISTASTFGSFEMYIPSYTVSQNKPFSGFAVSESNISSSPIIMGAANLWRNTAAVTSITFANQSSFQFLTGSSFYLYGISNA